MRNLEQICFPFTPLSYVDQVIGIMEVELRQNGGAMEGFESGVD